VPAEIPQPIALSSDAARPQVDHSSDMHLHEVAVALLAFSLAS